LCPRPTARRAQEQFPCSAFTRSRRAAGPRGCAQDIPRTWYMNIIGILAARENSGQQSSFKTASLRWSREATAKSTAGTFADEGVLLFGVHPLYRNERRSRRRIPDWRIPFSGLNWHTSTIRSRHIRSRHIRELDFFKHSIFNSALALDHRGKDTILPPHPISVP
jgi:hypothetical protein